MYRSCSSRTFKDLPGRLILPLLKRLDEGPQLVYMRGAFLGECPGLVQSGADLLQGPAHGVLAGPCLIALRLKTAALLDGSVKLPAEFLDSRLLRDCRVTQ